MGSCYVYFSSEYIYQTFTWIYNNELLNREREMAGWMAGWMDRPIVYDTNDNIKIEISYIHCIILIINPPPLQGFHKQAVYTLVW